MTLKQRLLIAYHEPKQCFIHIVRRMWLVGIKNRWNKLYIRKDEFHSSLDLDGEAMELMNEKEREKYVMDLVRRRNISHERGLD
jgi:hypothetical protein